MSCFNDPVVEEAMLRAMQECGVQYYAGYTLDQWNDGEECSEINSASFTSADEPLKLDCCVSMIKQVSLNNSSHIKFCDVFPHKRTTIAVYGYEQ